MPRVATKLSPAADGGWTARKRLPDDVKDAYAKLYGVRAEASFRCGPMSTVQARARHREWLSEIEARIDNIRAERKGEGQSLTQKNARALSGEWYGWFVQRHTEQPLPQAHWKLFLERLTDQIFRGVDQVRDDPSSPVREVWEGARTACGLGP
jgi:hypothetical protein